MEHAWTIVSKRVITEARTNSLSIIDIVDTLVFETQETEISALPIQLELVSLWWRTQLEIPEQGRGRMRIVYSPEDRVLDEREFEVNLVDTPRLRAFGSFEGFPYVGNGVYKFVVQAFDETLNDWQIVATVPLEVKWNK